MEIRQDQGQAQATAMLKKAAVFRDALWN